MQCIPRFLALLFLVVSAFSYEFTTNEALIKEIAQMGKEPTEGEADIASYIRANVASLPQFAVQDDLTRRMGLTIQYYDAVNRAFQMHMRMSKKGSIHAKRFPVYLVSAFWCMAKAKPDVIKFMAQFSPSDPTYQHRQEGFQSMQLSFLGMLQSMALMTGDPAIEDAEKVFMLSNAVKFTQFYRQVINKEIIKPQSEVFKRYDVSDQSAEVRALFKEMHETLLNW